MEVNSSYFHFILAKYAEYEAIQLLTQSYY